MADRETVSGGRSSTSKRPGASGSGEPGSLRARCRECDALLFEWSVWPRRDSGLDSREIGTTHLTCTSCGRGYIASTAATVLLHVAGIAALVTLIGLAVPVVLQGGRWWLAPALPDYFAGSRTALLVPGAFFLLFAAGVLALMVVGANQLSQLLTTVAWRAGVYRSENAAGASPQRVRVEHRGKPSLGGYETEEVLVDGEPVGPFIGAGQLGFGGCHSWYREREPAGDVDYYLRCWGTGLDVAHVLFRDGELWSEKRSGGISGPLIGATVVILLVELVAAILFDTADPSIVVLGAAAALGVALGVAIDPLLQERHRRNRAAPAGSWSPVEGASEWRWILRGTP